MQCALVSFLLSVMKFVAVFTHPHLSRFRRVPIYERNDSNQVILIIYPAQCSQKKFGYIAVIWRLG